jgi:hypothetical protein
MLRRATQQKDSIADLIEEEHSKWDGMFQPLDASKKPSVLDDMLTSEDWQILFLLLLLLHFLSCTKNLSSS